MIPATSSQVGIFATGALVSGIIDELEKSIAILIDQLDNRLSALSFQMRTELVFLQDELRKSGETLVGKTFSELSKQQQLFFENATTTISSVGAGLREADAEIDKLATQVEQIAAQFPFIGEEPRVRSSKPLYLTPPSEDYVSVSVQGSFLKHGDVELKLQDKVCKVTGHNDSQAIFSCPSQAFESPEKSVSFLSATFVVHEERSLWQSLGSLFGRKTPTKQYKLPIAVVSKVLGEYQVIATHMKDSVETKSRSGNWGRTNDHCRGRQSFTYNFGPASAEWKIDVNSIKTSKSCERRGGHAARNVSINGFQIESWAKNSGSCEKLLGKVVAYDGRGCSSGSVTWLESRNIEQRTETILGSGSLEWGKAVSFKLPDRLQGFLITVKQIDGKEIALNSAIPSKWFGVKRDEASTSIVVSPLELAAAMR